MIHALIVAAVMQHWLLVNDIHLDPFFRGNTVYGVGDTTPALWRLSLEAMRRDVPSAKVVIVGGDLLAHDWSGLARESGENPYSAAISTTSEIAAGLASAYPQSRFLVALGNNDDPCGDYRSETSGEYLAAITRIWAPLVERDDASPGFASQFGRGGYYTAALSNGERAIVLNSVFWSFANRTGCQSMTHGAGQDELSWLESQLGRLGRNERAVIVMHIPPGYDPQTTMMARYLVAVPFLSDAANGSLLRMLKRDRAKLAFAVGAHTHRYDFRVISGVPMIVGSSISPVYHNNPAFYELDVDDRGDLHDVVPFVYDPAGNRFVRKPSFDAFYGIASLTAEALTGLSARIRTDEVVRNRWILAHDAWADLPYPGGSWWLPNACAQTEIDGGFARCAGARFGSVPAAVATLLLLALGTVTAIIVLFALRRRVDRRT